MQLCKGFVCFPAPLTQCSIHFPSFVTMSLQRQGCLTQFQSMYVWQKNQVFQTTQNHLWLAFCNEDRVARIEKLVKLAMQLKRYKIPAMLCHFSIVYFTTAHWLKNKLNNKGVWDWWVVHSFIKMLNVRSVTKSLPVKWNAIKITGVLANGPCELLSFTFVHFCSICCFWNIICSCVNTQEIK